MTRRAVILGALLALAVASLTYFNDAVMKQTYLIGNFLPVSVYGVVLLLALTVNPLVGRLRRAWALRAGELAVVAALGLAACAWPGSGLYRTFTTALAKPADLARSKAGWNTAGVMSYVPGGSPLLADAHLRGLDGRGAPDAVPLADALRAEDASPAAATLWQAFTDDQRALLTELAEQGVRTGDDRAQAVEAINAFVERTGWVERLPGMSLPDEALRWLERRDQYEAELTGVLESLGELSRAEATGDDTVLGRIAALRARAQHLKDTATRQGAVYHAERTANRHALAAALPNYVLPPPYGAGVLPANGRADPWVTDGVTVPAPPDAKWPPDALPWRAWAPTLHRWLGLTLLLALAVVCLSVIVHPQWSRRELLPYPLVSFLNEAVARDDTNAAASRFPLPAVSRNKLFWIGLGAMLLLHGTNGLHAWFDRVPEVRTSFDLNPLKTLFPNTAEAPATRGVFDATLYPSVIAFTFFLTLSVGFSLSLATFAWMALAALVLGSGAAFGSGFYDAREGNLLRFGAYAGMVLMVLYTGRRHYSSVALGAAGWRIDPDETPRACVWAMRALVLLFALAVWWLQEAGLGMGWACVFLLMALGLWLVMSRIVAETGCFYLQAGWLPVGILAALLGDQAVGPTGLVVLGLASVLVVGDQREALMPFVVHALRLADRRPEKQGEIQREESVESTATEPSTTPNDRDLLPGGRELPVNAPGVSFVLGRAGVAVAGVAVLSLLVAGAVTFMLQYRLGFDGADRWATRWFPEMVWDDLTRRVQAMSADGALTGAAWDGAAQRLSRAAAEPGAWGWLLFGGTLVIGCAAARLRLPWWPLHPVMFLVWGTPPLERFAWSFVIGWAVKASVVKLGGAAGYRAAKPLMVGVIAGELLAALGWTITGAAYYLTTGTTPVSYIILPQ